VLVEMVKTCGDKHTMRVFISKLKLKIFLNNILE
jgi:hypothetical protein